MTFQSGPRNDLAGVWVGLSTSEFIGAAIRRDYENFGQRGYVVEVPVDEQISSFIDILGEAGGKMRELIFRIDIGSPVDWSRFEEELFRLAELSRGVFLSDPLLNSGTGEPNQSELLGSIDNIFKSYDRRFVAPRSWDPRTQLTSGWYLQIAPDGLVLDSPRNRISAVRLWRSKEPFQMAFRAGDIRAGLFDYQRQESVPSAVVLPRLTQLRPSEGPHPWNQLSYERIIYEVLNFGIGTLIVSPEQISELPRDIGEFPNWKPSGEATRYFTETGLDLDAEGSPFLPLIHPIEDDAQRIFTPPDEVFVRRKQGEGDSPIGPRRRPNEEIDELLNDAGENSADDPSVRTAATAGERAVDRSVTNTIHRDMPLDCESIGKDDPLGHAPVVSALYQLISHEDTKLPLSLAISAPWGSGKTSTMRWLQCELDARRLGEPHLSDILPEAQVEDSKLDSELGLKRKFKTVWIDAWRYEDGPTLWAALTNAMYEQSMTQLRSRTNRLEKLLLVPRLERLLFRLALSHRITLPDPNASPICKRVPMVFAKVGFRRLSKWSTWGALGVSGGIAASVVLALNTPSLDFLSFDSGKAGWTAGIGTLLAAASSIKGLIRSPFSFDLKQFTGETFPSTKTGYGEKVTDDINQLVKIMAPGENDGVAIFIDDLDRCSPDRVMEMLEAINLIFNSPRNLSSENANTVFILGMDMDMVAASIRVHYRQMVNELRRRGNPASADYGFRFLGKIVQLAFNLPSATQDSTRNFVESLVGNGSQEPSEPTLNGPKLTEDEFSALIQKLQASASSANSRDEFASEAEAIIDETPEGSRADVVKIAVNELRTQAPKRIHEDSPDVKDAIHSASLLLEQRPRELKRFVNAIRLQFLAMDQVLDSSRKRATPAEVGKWTALGMRWPSLGEVMRSSPSVLDELQEWADDRSFEPDDGWPVQISKLMEDKRQSAVLASHLSQPPLIDTRTIHGLLSVQ